MSNHQDRGTLDALARHLGIEPRHYPSADALRSACTAAALGRSPPRSDDAYVDGVLGHVARRAGLPPSATPAPAPTPPPPVPDRSAIVPARRSLDASDPIRRCDCAACTGEARTDAAGQPRRGMARRWLDEARERRADSEGTASPARKLSPSQRWLARQRGEE